MKKLICTKYLPATDFKGSRIKAWFADNPKCSETISFPIELDGYRAHLEAALKLAEKLRWNGNGFILDSEALPVINGYGFVVKTVS